MNKEKEILVVKVIDIFTIEDPKGDFMVGYWQPFMWEAY